MYVLRLIWLLPLLFLHILWFQSLVFFPFGFRLRLWFGGFDGDRYDYDELMNGIMYD